MAGKAVHPKARERKRLVYYNPIGRFTPCDLKPLIRLYL
jgi:hypothetical protein